MDTAIELDFADGRYNFWLAFPQIIELERNCGRKLTDGTTQSKSVFQIYDELSEGIGIGRDDGAAKFVGGGTANALDIKEVVRLGLIGGNSGIVDGTEKEVGPLTARNLVSDYIEARPLSEGLAVAWMVLNAAIVGVDLKKKAEEPAETPADMSPSGKG